MNQNPLSDKLLVWYKDHARKLPWRETRDPYAVWVSEIMLQQTRVETVLPYYRQWMAKFPDIKTLAEASQQEVLAVWEGLGYYSRARNLQHAAKRLMAENHGTLPEDVQSLQKLPGVGSYTARAIASIAFNADVPALDGNIRRVLSRVFNVDLPAGSKESEKRLWELAADCLPSGQAGAYNQALMDLGAGICTPRNPACSQCPIEAICQARALNIQEERPLRKAKQPLPHYTVTAAVILRNRKVLITQRKAKGILGGMWEFPGGKVEDGETLAECLQREIKEELDAQIQIEASFGVYKHAYTHFRFTLHAFRCHLLPRTTLKPLQVQSLQWIKPEALSEFPMGKVDRQIANRLMKEITQQEIEKESPAL